MAEQRNVYRSLNVLSVEAIRNHSRRRNAPAIQFQEFGFDL